MPSHDEPACTVARSTSPERTRRWYVKCCSACSPVPPEPEPPPRAGVPVASRRGRTAVRRSGAGVDSGRRTARSLGRTSAAPVRACRWSSLGSRRDSPRRPPCKQHDVPGLDRESLDRHATSHGSVGCNEINELYDYIATATMDGGRQRMPDVPRIISVDDHVLEPGDLSTERLPSRFRERARDSSA